MTKITEEYLSQSKYAEHRNVTKGYIGRLVKEGRLHLIKGKLNVAMSDAELDNKANDDKAPIHYDEEYSKMLTAEHCVTRFHKGVARREWVLKKGQRRNEALDIFVYNFVALKILNPNFEVLEKNMAGVEAKPLKKVNKPYKIRREGSFVSGFK